MVSNLWCTPLHLTIGLVVHLGSVFIEYTTMLTASFADRDIQYKNRRCDMIVHETAIQQMTDEFKLVQVPL